MAKEKMSFTISWDGPGSPTLVQLLDNSEVISLTADRITRQPPSITVEYEVEAYPTHHIEWTFTFIGQALSGLKAKVREGTDPTNWLLDSADSAKNQWNSEGWV